MESSDISTRAAKPLATRNEGVSPRRKNKIAVTGQIGQIGGPNFLYIFAGPASMETVGACASTAVLWGGQRPRGGGVLPYISHLGMCHRISVGLMHRFGLKTGTDFVYFGLESGTGFEGATDVSERIVSISKE